MLKAYVGVISKDGLAALQPEREESLSLVRLALWVEEDEHAGQSLDGLQRERALALKFVAATLTAKQQIAHSVLH